MRVSPPRPCTAGVDGVLLVDCPRRRDRRDCSRCATPASQRIFLAAPTTARGAAGRDLRRGRRFPILRVVRRHHRRGSAQHGRRTRACRSNQAKSAKTPVAVGFGVRDAASAAAIGTFADAVVIGSALVDRLSREPRHRRRMRHARGIFWRRSALRSMRAREPCRIVHRRTMHLDRKALNPRRRSNQEKRTT